MGSNLEAAIGILNGVMGDYLERSGNGLATPMQLVHSGSDAPAAPARPLAVERATLAAAYPAASPRAAVLVHGLMATESAWAMDDGATYGSLLARDFGVTPLFVRYNTGRHVSENGEALDALLDRLVDAYPVPLEELILIGHSMGGLVLRSAAHAASGSGHRWLSLVKRAFYIGTPHLGAPLERFGNVVTWMLRKVGDTARDPYTRLIAEVFDFRSSGIKDMRYANLRREDWDGQDADALLQNCRHPVPLLPGIRHHLVAGTLSSDPRVALLFGDAVVSLRSATGRARQLDRSAVFPQEHVRILEGLDHLRLTREPAVYAQIRAWCEEGS